ncbi:MAG: response regulator transcription factor [Candidatus Omnitrophica bacterium]|nr:response regulator transcription factor [Candidatus Omnitrophota bacterium]
MKNRKVAVIDDDKKFLGEIENILTMGGYVPVAVHDPLLFMDTVVESKPDIILLELRMPRKNGFEITETINRVFETKRMPIIAMSAFFRDEFRSLLDFCGIKRWLKKPFYPLDMFWAIENEIREGNQWDRERRLTGVDIMT